VRQSYSEVNYNQPHSVRKDQGKPKVDAAEFAQPYIQDKSSYGSKIWKSMCV